MSILAFVQWVFLAAGACLLGAGGAQAVRTQAFLRAARPVEGEVLSLRKHHGEHGATYAPLVRYRGPDGAERELASEDYASPPAYRLGERVTVLCDPADPVAARLGGFFPLWGWAVILAGAGGLLALVGGGLWAGRRAAARAPGAALSGRPRRRRNPS